LQFYLFLLNSFVILGIESLKYPIMKKSLCLLIPLIVLLTACSNNPRSIADQVMKDMYNLKFRYIYVPGGVVLSTGNFETTWALVIDIYAKVNVKYDYSSDTDREFYNSLFDLPQNIKSYDYLESWDNPDNKMFQLTDVSEDYYVDHFKSSFENYETFKSKWIELYRNSEGFEYLEDKQLIKHEAVVPEKRFYYLVETDKRKYWVTICMYQLMSGWKVGAIFKEVVNNPNISNLHAELYKTQSKEFIEKRSRPWSKSKSNESIMISEKGFPGNSPELLLNKTIKPKEVRESLQEYSYKNFFLEFNKKEKKFTRDERTNKPFPSGPAYNLRSDYSKLVGREFKVIAIYEIASVFKEYAIEIEHETIGTIYYKYNPEFEFDFELEVIGGLNYPEDYPEDHFCKEIRHKVDKFENEESFFTPTEAGISFMKTIINGKPNIYLIVRIVGVTLNVREQGLFILFSDGTKIMKPEAKIDVGASGGGYVYKAFIALTKEEINLLSNKIITDTKLFIYERTVDKESAVKIKEYLKCIVEK
jgi:hypothetical protein